MAALSAILSPTIDLLKYLETSIDCEWISPDFNLCGVEFTVSREDEPADEANPESAVKEKKSDANKENKPAPATTGEKKKGKKGKKNKKLKRKRKTEPSLRISLLKRLLRKRIDEVLGENEPIEVLHMIAEQEQQQSPMPAKVQRSRPLLSFDFFNRSFQ